MGFKMDRDRREWYMGTKKIYQGGSKSVVQSFACPNIHRIVIFVGHPWLAWGQRERARGPSTCYLGS